MAELLDTITNHYLFVRGLYPAGSLNFAAKVLIMSDHLTLSADFKSLDIFQQSSAYGVSVRVCRLERIYIYSYHYISKL